jgi:succinyl-diaminopimelate desuccinylase
MSESSQSALKLARALIRCPSITPVDAGAIELLQVVLNQAGAECHRLTFSDENTPKVDNLYARLGSGAPHLCFAGHTDVVPPGDEARWRFPPFAAELHEGVLYGRGAADMKGAIACFVDAALGYAQCAGTLPGSISFLITGDEEGPAINGTRKVLAWMEAKGEIPDHCLLGEPTNPEKLGQSIKIGRRGSLNGIVEVGGVQGHVAYPHLANNPVRGLLKVLTSFYEAPLDAGTDYFVPSNLEVTSIDVGNPVENVIPARAEARFNIRFNDKHGAADLQALLHKRAEEAIAGSGLDLTLTFPSASEAFRTELGTLDTLLGAVVEEVTGLKPALSTDGGTSDARFIKDYWPVIEFGLVNATVHKVDEHVPVADLEQLTRIYRLFIERYFQTFGRG